MNLDAMEPDDLLEFCEKAALHPTQVGRRLFPERPRGYVAATEALATYALNKAVAMSCRLKNKVDQAELYERACQRIYESLPPFARW